LSTRSEQFRDAVDYDTFTIHAGPPRPDGSYGAAGPYVVLIGDATLGVANHTIDIDGDVFVEVSHEQMELRVAGTLNTALDLIPISRLARPHHQSQRLVGSLQVAAALRLACSTAARSDFPAVPVGNKHYDSDQTVQVLDVATAARCSASSRGPSLRIRCLSKAAWS